MTQKILRVPSKAQNRAPSTPAHDQPEASPPVSEPLVVRLQRVVGNQAVLRMMESGALVSKHAPLGHEPVVQRKETGLLKSKLATEFASEALSFWKDEKNKDKPLKDLADCLMTKVNDKLKSIPSHPCKHAYTTSGSMGAFDFTTWTLEMNTSKFTERSGVSKVSDLNADEVAEIVDTIYHESRHSEQFFRMAQMLAGQGKDAKAIASELSLPPDVAAEAVKSPLDAKDKKNADLLEEASDWYAMYYGKYLKYRNSMYRLRDNLNEMDGILKKHDPKDDKKTLDALKVKVDAIKKLFDDVFDKDLDKIEKLKTKSTLDESVCKHLKEIKAGFDDFKSEYDKKSPDVAKLKTLHGKLVTARYEAYRDFEEEKDAWKAGEAAGGAFKTLSKKK